MKFSRFSPSTGGDQNLASARRKLCPDAAPTTMMSHLAIQEQLDGKTVDWLEKVSDEQYQG